MKKIMNDYLYLKVINVSYNKLLFRLNKIGINIYEYKKVDNNIIIKVKKEDYKKIKKYLITYDIRKIKYDGYIYYKKVLTNNIINIICIFLSIAFVIFSSNIIVDIKYNITDKELINKLNNKLSEYNMGKFSLKKSYNSLEKIKKKILNDFNEEIEWLEITRKGMIYVIDIEKRVQNNIINSDKYCNIYASKDGLIKDIIVSEGISNVTMNDYVKKGDILISGDIYYNDKLINQVCANGTVMAEVWYKVNVSVPFIKYENIKTGKVRNNIILNYDNYDIKIFKDRIKTYNYERYKFFDALGIKLYLEKDYEIVKKKTKLSQKEALEQAKNESIQKISNLLKEEDFIVKQKVLQKNVNNSTIEVEIFVVTNENISMKGLNE